MKDSLSIVLIFIIGIALILGCGGGSGNSTTSNPGTPATNTGTAPPAEKAVAIDAKALTKEYDSNELAADGKYKGKSLAVTGKISNIAETLGNITVSLEGHEFTKTVMCSFEESEKASVAALKKGDKITLTGTGDGSTGGLYVGLQNCKVAAATE